MANWNGEGMNPLVDEFNARLRDESQQGKPMPLASFNARRAVNGGWTINHYENIYAFTSDEDMLAALPGLIGVRTTPSLKDMIESHQKPSPTISGEFDWNLMSDTLKANLMNNEDVVIADGIRLRMAR